MSDPLPDIQGSNQEQLAVLRALCLQRFDFFCAAVMGLKVTPFHAKMIAHWMRIRHGMLLAPRGSGKSKICDVAYIIWRILHNPNIRIGLVSKTGPQVKGFLGEIKAHFEQNADLRLLFGDYVSEEKWNEDEIVVSKRTRILKEPTVCAKAVGSGIPSYHFDMIMADDLCDLENTSTELQREKMINWFDIVLAPTLEPDTGEFRVLGTRYNSADIYGTLAEKKEYEVEVDDPAAPGQKKTVKEVRYTREDFGPHTLVIPAIERDESGEEVSFWPEKFTLAMLQKLRRQGLLAFNLAYQNDASISEGGIIMLEDLEACVWYNAGDLPPRDQLAIFQGIDPAISQKQTADFFAHCTIGVHGRHIYVLELVLARMQFDDQVQFCIERRRSWNPDLVGIETIAYQQALAQAIRERDVWFPIHEIKPNKDKTFRAHVFSQFTKRRELHMAATMTDHIQTLVKMPNVKHDDAFDAIDHAVTAAKQMILTESVIAVLPTNFRRR